jgi:small-conductance mechanosensitive channel/CRP-like cAMP-binding protein
MADFVQEVVAYSWHYESPYVLVMTALLAAILYRWRREDRRTLVNTIGFFALSVLGQVASGVMHALGLTTAAEVVREASIIAGGVALVRLGGMVLFRVVLPGLRFAPPHILEDITVMLAYIGWGLVRLRYAGLHLSEIVTASAVITAVIAFSMQDTLGNVLGGIALQLDDSIKIGDWLKVDDVVGRVTDIRWRSTLLETRNWETVVVPNGLLMKGKFAVLGRRADRPVQWRRWIAFNVDYSAAPQRVIDTVEAEIRQAVVPNVAREPAPNVVLIDFDHGFGRYALRYWLTDLAQDDGTDTAVRSHVFAALQRAGMRLAVPESSVHTTKEGEKHEEAVRTRELARRLSALRRVDLFAKFSDEELLALAERLVYAPFARGAVIMRQGSTAHWLYVSTAGEVEVYAEAPGQARALVNTLPAGSFFGEMGLMTGAPRTATVMAKTDVECYRLDKAAFEDIVQSRPSIAEEITQILIARRAALDEAMRLAGGHPDATGPVQQGELLARIRRFFGLAA